MAREEAARAVVTEKMGSVAVEMEVVETAEAKTAVAVRVEEGGGEGGGGDGVAVMVEVVREVVTGKFRARKQRRCTRPPSLTHARRGRACWHALLAKGAARPVGTRAELRRSKALKW